MKISDRNIFERKILRGSIDDYLSKYPNLDTTADYYEKKIAKRNNEARHLHCIRKDSDVATFQRELKNNFLNYIPLSEYACGFIKNKSYKDFLLPHRDSKYFLKVDIKDYFWSIKSDKLKDVLSYYIDEIMINQQLDLCDLIVGMVTVNGRLPQGAITSPVLSNIFFRNVDIRINRYCRKFDVTYTRYADDLLFSSNNLKINKKMFLNGIVKILKDNNFKLNPEKTLRSKSIVSLNGFVVGSGSFRLSRKKRAILSTIVYCYDRFHRLGLVRFIKELKDIYKMNSLSFMVVHSYLSGYRAFLIGLLPIDSSGTLSKNLSMEDSKNLVRIKKIEEILDFILK